jgi:hypothetical protein
MRIYKKCNAPSISRRLKLQASLNTILKPRPAPPRTNLALFNNLFKIKIAEKNHPRASITPPGAKIKIPRLIQTQNSPKLKDANGAKEEGTRIRTKTKGATKTLIVRVKISWMLKICLNHNLIKTILKALNLMLARI